jgi:hypothetical protein
MKIIEFFLIIWAKWSELEPEFLTSWSLTKIDRLRNTDCHCSIIDPPYNIVDATMLTAYRDNIVRGGEENCKLYFQPK